MTKTIWTAACSAIVVGAAIGVMAQAPATQPPTPPSTSPSTPPSAQQPAPEQGNTSADHKVTVTGCLRAAPTGAATDTAAAAPGTAGTTGTTAAQGAATDADAKFVLADAKTSATDTAPAQTYRLIANPAALTPHVGKKLELTGTIVDAASAPGGAAGAATGPALRVEAGKVLAASCEQ